MPLAPYLKLLRGIVLRDRPIYVHYGVTSRCNLRCKSCVIWRRGRAEHELTLAEVGQLARMVARLGCVHVSLGGGEPAMRQDLPQIVRAFLNAGVQARVLSNGLALTPRLVRRLLDAGLREVSVSFDSLDPQTQDELDNAPTFHRRMDNLLAMAELLPRRGALPLLNTVVTRSNFRQLPRIVDFAAAIGFYVSLIPIHLAHGQDEHRFYSTAQELSFAHTLQAELAQIYDELLRRKAAGAPIINSSAFLRRSPSYLLQGSMAWPCDAGQLFLSVGPDGAVGSCHAFEGSDDVPFSRFERHFHAPDYQARARRKVQACEGCFRPCWAEVGYMVHDGRALVEMARLQLRSRLSGRAVDTAAARAMLELDQPATGQGPPP